MKTQAERPTEVEAKFTVADPTLLRELAKPKTAVVRVSFWRAAHKGTARCFSRYAGLSPLAPWILLAHACRGWPVAGNAEVARRRERCRNLPSPGDRGATGRSEPSGQSRRSARARSSTLWRDCRQTTGTRRHLPLDQTRQVREVTSASPGRKQAAPSILALLSLDEIRIRQSEEGAVLARARNRNRTGRGCRDG